MERPRCEYCVATQRRCHYPDDDANAITFVLAPTMKPEHDENEGKTTNSPTVQCLVSPLVAKLNLPHTVMGMSGFELRLLQHYNQWGERYNQSQDLRQLVLWKQVMPQMHMLSVLIKRCVFAFSGMLALADTAPEVLWSDLLDDTAPALAQLHRFSFASFDHQVQLTLELVADLQKNTISPENLGQLLVLTLFVMMVVGYLPLMPMVDFERRQGDYISLLEGTKATHWMAYTRLKLPVLEYGMLPQLEMLEYSVLPLFKPYFSVIDDAELTPPQLKLVLSETLVILSQAVYECLHQCTDIPLFRFFYAAPSTWYTHVYDQHFAALALVNLLCASQLLVGYQFDRQHNMQVEYMRWYRQHNLGKYGDWRLEFDKHLYEAVVTQGLQLTYTDLKTFDPSRHEANQR